MGDWQRNSCAIAGIGETKTFSTFSGQTELGMAVEAITNAAEDAGLPPGEIDGLITYELDHASWPGWLASNLGLKELKYWGLTPHGGNASCGVIGQAVAAINAGLASTVVCYRSLNGRSGRRFGTRMPGNGASQEYVPSHVGGDKDYAEFINPFGLVTPAQIYALMTQRHMHEYGTTSEQLGAISVVCRENACRNPHAQTYGRPITLDDHQNSRIISAPLHLFDCCLETDGASAVIVTSAERARDLRQSPAYIRAVTQGSNDDNHGPFMVWPTKRDITQLSTSYVAERLYAMAGVGPSEIKVAQFYDCFTISVLLQIEGYGFCAKGEGGAFVEGGDRIRPGGAVTINTAGGNLSEGYIHGLNHVVEGVRQIRGTSTTQVPDADLCLVTAGVPIETAALILDRG